MNNNASIMTTKHSLGVSTHVLSTARPEAHFELFAAHHFSLVELGLGYFHFLENSQKFSKLQAAIHENHIRVFSFHLPYGGTIPELGNMDISHPDPGVRRDTIDCIRLCYERLMLLNASCLVIHPSVGAIEDSERSTRLDRCIESLHACWDMAGKLRRTADTALPRLAVETMKPIGLLNNTREIATLTGQFDSNSVGLCLDVNHVNLAGQDPVAFTREVGNRVISTHLSDNDGVDERHWMPGRGILPWQEWFAALLTTGYSGPFLYETSQEEGVSDQDTITELRRNAVKLAGLIESR